MTTSEKDDYDVLVIGAGISGLGAALELKELGLKVCVLEKESRVGGRMTTDRIGGFAIDRGVTIFGSEFKQMRQVVKKLHLSQKKQWFGFSFGLLDKQSSMSLGRTRLAPVFCSPKFGWKAKAAMIRFGIHVLLQGRKLNHGFSRRATSLDNESVNHYLNRIGGDEFLGKVLLPSLNGPLGGVLASNSRLVLFQTFWNILLLRTWAMKGGLDQIPEAMAKEVEVVTGCAVKKVETGERCRVSAVVNGDERTFSTKGVILALPGNRVPEVCGELPEEVLDTLSQTRYSSMTSAHVLLQEPPQTNVTALGVDKSFGYGYEIELEHNRVKELCPHGKGMASIYFWDEGENPMSKRSDSDIKQHVEGIVANCFPECRDKIEGVHILRWKEGIAQFPVGRLNEMVQLRQQMANWQRPLQLCGDYLDGISSEGALVTGQEAARNLFRYLNKKSLLRT